MQAKRRIEPFQSGFLGGGSKARQLERAALAAPGVEEKRAQLVQRAPKRRLQLTARCGLLGTMFVSPAALHPTEAICGEV
jgi:hypothetical protein